MFRAMKSESISVLKNELKFSKYFLINKLYTHLLLRRIMQFSFRGFQLIIKFKLKFKSNTNLNDVMFNYICLTYVHLYDL